MGHTKLGWKILLSYLHYIRYLEIDALQMFYNIVNMFRNAMQLSCRQMSKSGQQVLLSHILPLSQEKGHTSTRHPESQTLFLSTEFDL